MGQQQGGYGQPAHNPYGGQQGGYGQPSAAMQSAHANAWYNQYYQQIQQQELQKLQAWFTSVDADRSGSITAHELQKVTFGGFPLTMAIAIKLVKVFDKDRSGTIDFIEYASMHQFITLMQKSFTQADRDRNGSLAINFPQFLQMGADITLLKSKFEWSDSDRDGVIHVNFTQLLEICADL